MQASITKAELDEFRKAQYWRGVRTASVVAFIIIAGLMVVNYHLAMLVG